MKKVKKLYNKLSRCDKIISLITLIMIVIVIAITVIRFIYQRDYNQLLSDVVLFVIMLGCAVGFFANILGKANVDNMVSEKLEEVLEEKIREKKED